MTGHILGDARKASTAIPLPGDPWREPVVRYASTSQLRNTTRREYGQLVPMWDVRGWSSGERRLWEALAAFTALLPLLDEVRARCDDHEVGALAGLVETLGAAMQPEAVGGKGVAS